jgi:hypothetical protein
MRHNHVEKRARDLDTPPDWWVDSDERDFQFVDRRCGLLSGHKRYSPSDLTLAAKIAPPASEQALR